MRTNYQDQVNRIKIQLNEKTERQLSTSTIGGPDIGGAYEAEREAERRRQADPEYQRRLEREISAYVGEVEARKKIPGIELGRDVAARELQNRLDYEQIGQAQRAGITRLEREGKISKEQAIEKRNLTRQREQEEESRKRTDRLLHAVEVGADVAGTVATTGLLFSNPASAPFGIARLGRVAITAPRLGVYGTGAQAGTDFYKAAMTDDPQKAAEYTTSGLYRAGGLAAGIAIGKGLELTARGAKALDIPNDLRTIGGMYAARAAANIPGAAKAIELGGRVTKAIQSTPGSEAGGIGGGLAGIAAGTQMINPAEDNLAVQAGKVIGMGILGSIAGKKGIGWAQQKFPTSAIPIAIGGSKERAAKLISQQLEKIGSGSEPLVVQGFQRIPDRSRVVGGRLEREQGGLIPSDKPTGIWQPNPESQTIGTGLPRRGAATQDYGYPPYPETHVGRPDQEVVRMVPWEGTGEPPIPPKKIKSIVTDPNNPFIMWGSRGTKR